MSNTVEMACNSSICIDNRLIKFKSLLDRDLIPIADLISNNGSILNQHELVLKYNVNIKFMVYNCTIIPTELKHMIKNHDYKSYVSRRSNWS